MNGNSRWSAHSQERSIADGTRADRGPASVVRADGVVILSPEIWSGLPTNKHQLARRYAATVPTLYVHSAGRSVMKHVREGLRLRRTRSLERISEGLWVLEPMVLPETVARCVGVISRVNRWLVHRSARSAIAKLGLSRPVLFAYSPSSANSLGRLGEVASVYHCVDHYGSFPSWQGRVMQRVLSSGEARLLSCSDLVITTSQALTRHCESRRRDVVELPNVGDYQIFARVSDPGPVAVEVEGLAKPVLFFHGAFDANKIDLSLLATVATQRKDWTLVLIGPKAALGSDARAFDRLTSMANVHWFGYREQKSLPEYLRAADVLLLPYAINEHTRHVFPLKFFEYLATGKPVVGTALPALAEYADVISMVTGAATMVEAIDRVLSADGSGASLRRALAERNTWECRLASINALLLDRAGVVIHS